MKTTVRFEHVSKKYKLGLTRTSVPSLISGWLTQLNKRASSRKPLDNSFWALKDVSFELQQGESLALVGANGAGKTTILKLLANITRPTSGSINIDGRLSALIELGAGFHPDLTGRENIFLNGIILGLGRKQISNRFDEIVDFSELEEFIDTPVKRYSSGMTVRLGFAVASCIKPEILLVDEVLAVGDASFQQKCLNRIQSLIRDGTSIIFVSHNFYLVRAICDQALYLNRGQVADRGNTLEVIASYERALHEERARRFEGSGQEQAVNGLDLEITKVEVVDMNGVKQSTLLSNQPAQVRIHYNAYRSIGNTNASVHIVRSDGLTCCEMRTSFDQVRFSVNRGQGVVSVTLNPIQLISGTYYAEGGFLNESDSMGIVVKQSDWFFVKGEGLSYQERNGIFRPITRWVHQKNGNGIGHEEIGSWISK
jgi:lipopolysaccharide transport system ATP-binding protein